jgi:NTP pyrophosphatase (non-canonical NTP hydrolase)
MTIEELQTKCIELKRRNHFNLSADKGNIAYEFCLLQGEMTEAFDAWREKKADLGEEIADIIMYAVGLGGLLGLDMDKEVTKKLQKNGKRTYYIDADGIMRKHEG